MHSPSFLRADPLKQRTASLVDLVSAPHVQHLITKKDIDELAKHGFLIAESLDACALACTHAAAVSLAVHTMKDISVLYTPAEVQGFPDVVRALLNHFAQLDEAAHDIPWSTPQDGQLALQAFKQHYNMAAIAAPKLDGHLRDLRTAVERFLPGLDRQAADTADAAWDEFFSACHNARMFVLWHEDPTAFRASLNVVEMIATCSAAAAVWQHEKWAIFFLEPKGAFLPQPYCDVNEPCTRRTDDDCRLFS